MLTIILDNYDKKSRDPVKVQGLERAMAWEQRYHIFHREEVSDNCWGRLKGERVFQNILIFTVWMQGRTLESVLIFKQAQALPRKFRNMRS